MKKIEITFKGKTETYAYKNNVNYEKAVKFCEKKGGTLPTRWFLWEYDHDQGKYRWELLGEKLKKVEDENFLWACTSDEYGSCCVWFVDLNIGITIDFHRNHAQSNHYALCTPALTL